MNLEEYKVIKAAASAPEVAKEQITEASEFIEKSAVGFLPALIGGTVLGLGINSALNDRNVPAAGPLPKGNLPGMGPNPPDPSTYGLENPTGNPYWDAEPEDKQEWLRLQKGLTPETYGPPPHTEDKLDPYWLPPRLGPISAGPYEENHAAYISPENKHIIPWNPSNPDDFRQLIQFNQDFTMHPDDPEKYVHGQDVWNYMRNDSNRITRNNIDDGLDPYADVEAAEQAYWEKTHPYAAAARKKGLTTNNPGP